jgi:formylmethanofuran dehydrogenase subunit B
MTDSLIYTHISCPFCGLACDDLTLKVDDGKIRATQNACQRSAEAFASLDPLSSNQPQVNGVDTSLEKAVQSAAKILRQSVQPLFGGLSTDVAGMRALMQLGDACGATFDHMNSESKMRNLLVLQDSGFVNTTFAEVKNHADLIIFFGTDAVSRFPRFFERLVWNKKSLAELDTKTREIMYLGEAKNTQAGVAPDGRKPTMIKCANQNLGEVAGALRALLDGKTLQAEQVGGIKISIFEKLLEKIQTAKYTVFCWSAADLNFPHAELAVQSLAELIKSINEKTRCAGLPLGGTDADVTANAVHTWQSGFPIRTSFASGKPDFDPLHFSAQRMLDSDEADALLWVSSFDEKRLPPETKIPTIFLGRAGMKPPKATQVFIPIATPGADHTGHFYRSDKIVALPLRKLRETLLPSVEQVAVAIEKAWRGQHAD